MKTTTKSSYASPETFWERIETDASAVICASDGNSAQTEDIQDGTFVW